MTTTRPILSAPLIGSILLGRFAVWQGAVVAPIYLALFVLATTQGGPDRPAIAEIALPTLLPVVGLGLAGLGALVARMFGRPTPWVCIAGLAINGLSLAMSIALPLVRP